MISLHLLQQAFNRTIIALIESWKITRDHITYIIIIDSWKLRMLITKGLFSPLVYHLCSLNEYIFPKYLFKFIFFSPLTSKLSFTLFRCQAACFLKRRCNSVLPFPSSVTHLSFYQWKISRLLFPELSTFSVQCQNRKHLKFCLLNFSNFIAINIVCKCLHFLVKMFIKWWFY